ncbi:D-sedoheptulose 7-phosphate isomerase [Desulfuromonas acetoxidans]|nr:D-sedoheptulose 7-phosphate isomerase [Desulfuromonas acetoxidans]MBF0645932.1 D-sedoheptulose 7-phosphate isomerase [Desulfuromonas acetoxidans]NVD25493.1 D-sedoheptulose 7-phosphate isomerase [Desulfuromonas acetoxidans]NVE17557.1 D-sedoheptulose 7-phosphate isomerase [Desulfuromonas acetoxidans]
MQEIIDEHLRRHIDVFEQVVLPMSAQVEAVAQALCNALKQGHKVLVMGNGGSAADSQHLAAELVGRFLKNRAALPAIALTTDTSILTAVANDFGYDTVFSRQVEALAQPGDVVIGISTSGNSPNVLAGLQVARDKACVTVALTGRNGGKMVDGVDLPLNIAVDDTPRIQEAHLTLIHILCDLVERELFDD